MGKLWEHRCNRCGKLLFKGHIVAPSAVEITCSRSGCDALNIFPREHSPIARKMEPDGVGGYREPVVS